MSRRKRKSENRNVRNRRVLNAQLNSILRSEPVIRVHDRRDRYESRRISHLRKRKMELRKEFDRVQAPRRYQRKLYASAIANTFGEGVYKKVHNCKQEWRKLLSWRSAQGSGRKRTQVEMRNNKQSFTNKDC